MSSSKPSWRRRALVTVLLSLVALAIRVPGVDSDLPGNRLAFDEDYVVSDAFHFAADRTLVPNTYFYPPFYSYLVTGSLGAYYLGGRAAGAFESVDEFGWHHFLYPGRFHLAGRILTLLFAAATIVAVQRLGAAYRSDLVGFVAALLVAGERVHAERSHYALPDVPATFFATLAALGLVAVARRGRIRDHVLFGLALGLAAATKYNAAVVAIGFPFAHLASHGWRIGPAVRARGPWIALAVAALAFLVAAPTWLLVPERAAAGLEFEQANVRVGGHLGQTPGDAWLWIPRGVLGLEPLLAAFLFLGVLATPFRRTAGTAALVAVALGTFLYVGTWTKQSLHYLLPVVPIVAVLAADLLAALVEAAPEPRPVVPWFLALIAIAPGARDTVAWGVALYRPDTRDQARAWIEAHVPRRASIAVDSNLHPHLPPLADLEHFERYAEGNRDAPGDLRAEIEAHGRTAPLFRLVSVRAPLESPDVPERFRDVVEANPSLARHFSTRWKTPRELAEEGVAAIVTSSDFRGRFEGTLPSEDSVLAPFVADGAAFYASLDASDLYELAATFEPDPETVGPTIRVYLRTAPETSGDGVR